MPEAGFFVRVRGRVSGPFDIEALRRMARTGALSRIHEVSPDRTSWARASDYEDLFPMTGSTRKASEFSEEPILTPIDALDLEPLSPVSPPPPPRMPNAARGPAPVIATTSAPSAKTKYAILLIAGLLLILCAGAVIAILLASSFGTPAPGGGSQTPAATQTS